MVVLCIYISDRTKFSIRGAVALHVEYCSKTQAKNEDVVKLNLVTMYCVQPIKSTATKHAAFNDNGFPNHGAYHKRLHFTDGKPLSFDELFSI